MVPECFFVIVKVGLVSTSLSLIPVSFEGLFSYIQVSSIHLFPFRQVSSEGLFSYVQISFFFAFGGLFRVCISRVDRYVVPECLIRSVLRRLLREHLGLERNELFL